MAMNYGYGYGYNNLYGGLGLGFGMPPVMNNNVGNNNSNNNLPTSQNQAQLSQNPPIFLATVVSNIAEVNSTPADATGKPLFFYNKSQNEIYIKQYDSDGSAPIRTFRLVEANEADSKSSVGVDTDKLDTLNNKIDKMQNYLQKLAEKTQEKVEEIEEENTKKVNKNAKQSSN